MYGIRVQPRCAYWFCSETKEFELNLSLRHDIKTVACRYRFLQLRRRARLGLLNDMINYSRARPPRDRLNLHHRTSWHMDRMSDIG